MPQQVIDYDALAAKARTVDYDALAEQARTGTMPTAPAAAPMPDYLKGMKGYIKNPFKQDAKTTGTLTVRDDAGKVRSMVIGDNVPAWQVPATIEKNIYMEGRMAENPVLNAVGNFAQGLNPLPFLKQVATHPVDTYRSMSGAPMDEFVKAGQSAQKGEYSQAIGHGLASQVPILGQGAVHIGEQFKSGDTSGAIGAAAAMFAPEAASALLKARNIPIVPSMLTKNPAEASAVRFGLREGLPVDAATATGNPGVRGLQWAADKSIGGSFINQATKAEGAAKLTGKLDELANPTGGAIHPEQAGAGVRRVLESKIESQHAEANAAYTELRKIEADPKNLQKIQTGTQPAPISVSGLMGAGPKTIPIYENIALPVDMRNVKAELAPIAESMEKTMPQAQIDASPGLKALKQIINGPDYVSASIADQNLSAVKRIARGAESQFLRNRSQGVAAKSVAELGDAVDAAVAKGGKDAIDALKRGREATKVKYEVAETLDKLREEPVQAFHQMVYSKDAAIEQLRDIASHAPGEMPKVGSAFLNDILDTATAQGGFDRASGAWAKWDKLGAETKKVLFKDPKYIKNLDDFFLLAKKLEENPNPSGSAFVVQTGAMTAAAATGHLGATAATALSLAGLSKILHSPRAVNLMVNGLKVSGKVPVAAITAANLASVLDSNTKKLAVPANVARPKP